MQFLAGRPWRLLPASAFVFALVVVGCGGSSDDDDAPAGNAAQPDASAFPAADGRTLEEIATEEGTEGDLVVAPAGQVFHEGENRFGFGVFTVDREAVSDAEVALYVSRPNKPATGPYPAAVESLEPSAPFRSETTALDPDAARVVYAADVDFHGKGEQRVLAMVRDGDSYTWTVVPSAVVGQFPGTPEVGEDAPVVETQTPDDVGGDLTKIDTRQPPSTLHDEDYRDVVGEKPIVMLFATPALCQSRVCGPVVDIAEEVKSERPDDAAYILQEIYKDNVVDKGLRKQVEAFKLPTEPWLFVIDTDGKVSTAIEGAFSEGELNDALDKVNG